MMRMSKRGLLGLLALGLLVGWSLAQPPRPTPQPIVPGQSLGGAATPTLNPLACPTPLSIPLNSLIYIKPGVNIRNLPTLSGGLVWNTVYDQFDADGEPLEPQLNIPALVLEGPVCANGYNWWRITFTDTAGNDGWVAEGRPEKAENGFSGYNLILGVNLATPTPTLGLAECVPPRSFPIGARAFVRYGDGAPKSLRSAPDLDAALLATLVDGVPLLIEGGPVCADGLNWWQVRVLASQPLSGWMAEGSPYVGYWIRLLGEEFAR